MTTYVYTPPDETSSTDWDDSAAWTPTGVPDDPSATVVIDYVAPLPGLYDSTNVVISSGESYAIGSLDLGAGMTLTIDGSLAVSGAADFQGNLSMEGTLMAGSLTVASGQDLSLGGLVDVSGSFTNGAQIEGFGMAPGSALTIRAGSFSNSGLIVGNVTIQTAAGGFTNLVDGTLTGGTYGGDPSDTLQFDVGALIRTDASDIALDGGAIASVDPSTGDAVAIEQSLTEVAAGGTLQIGAATVWNTLTVDGLLAVDNQFSANSLTVDAGGLVQGDEGSIVGAVTNDGEIECELNGGPFLLIGNVAGTGTIVLDGAIVNSDLYPPAPSKEALGASVLITGTDTNNVAFFPGYGTLELDDAPGFAGTISGFTASSNFPVLEDGNTIVLGGLADASITGVSYAGNASGGTLQIDAGGTEIDLRFVGDYTLASFALSVDPFDSTSTSITENPCFVAGTALDTAAGPVAVEHIAAGDAVRLHDGRAALVTWVGHRRATDARVVRVRRHALGPGMPRRDLCVSHDHALFVDGVLVPACVLVNRISIVEERWSEATFHHVELAAHAILLAEGAPAESYLDTGNRAQFGNCSLSYDPSQPAGEPCAEFVVAGRRLGEVRASVPMPA